MIACPTPYDQALDPRPLPPTSSPASHPVPARSPWNAITRPPRVLAYPPVPACLANPPLFPPRAASHRIALRPACVPACLPGISMKFRFVASRCSVSHAHVCMRACLSDDGRLQWPAPDGWSSQLAPSSMGNCLCNLNQNGPLTADWPLVCLPHVSSCASQAGC